MRLRFALSHLGRKKRLECAEQVSSQLLRELENAPLGDVRRVSVVSQKHLRAFRSRPLSPAASERVTKFYKRVQQRIWKEWGEDAVTGLDYSLRDGDVLRLTMTAYRRSTT